MPDISVTGSVTGPGFHQDANQLAPAHYRVILTLTGGTATFPTSDLNTNGAVNPFPWGASNYSTRPSTQAYANRIARGNMRWQNIIEEASKYADLQVLDVQMTAADTTADVQPKSVTFTLKYDRGARADATTTDGDSLLAQVRANRYATASNYNDFSGSAITTTAQAIRQLVAAAIIRGGSSGGYAKSTRVYDATRGADSQVQITILQPDTSANVFADVAVSVLDGTELVTSN
jgi:hypothetical protein